MLAQVSGLKVGKLIHVIADAHIYDRHIEIAKELVENPQYDAPTFSLDETITNFYDFTTKSIKLDNYQFTDKKYNIEVAV